MDRPKDTGVEAFLEQLIEHGPNDIAGVFARAFDLALRIERERFLDAGHHERTANRQDYANGTKPKRIDTPAGTVSVQVPRTAGHDGAPFHPQSLERGRRSVRAVMLAVAGMYIKGVSTREVETVMREFGVERLSSSQVSRATKLLDEEPEAWRTRSLGETRYLILDARYEKVRIGAELRAVWNAASLAGAETALADLVTSYRDSAPKLADWLEENVPEGLRLLAARAPPPPFAHLKPCRAGHPAGAQTPNRQGQGLSRTRNRCCAWSAQCWSKSTRNWPPTPGPISNGNARMRDRAKSEFPDNRLRNRLTGARLDRLTHHVNILGMNGESYRLNQSRSRLKTGKQ